MFRAAITALFLSASVAGAQDADISGQIARDGLAATAERLNGATTPSDRLALGGVLFLRGIEKTLQTRWRHGMAKNGSMLPVLRLPVGKNPNPEPFRPELVVEIFATLNDDMTAARAPLADIGDADEATFTLSLADLWFDINMDGVRDTNEGLLQVAGSTLRMRTRPNATAPTIRFDTADAAWLSAYTHFLSAFGDLVLAVDPTDAIRGVLAASEAMQGLGTDSKYSNA